MATAATNDEHDNPTEISATTTIFSLNPYCSTKSAGEGEALVHWMELYWLPTQHRKHPLLLLELQSTPEPQLHIQSLSSSPSPPTLAENTATEIVDAAFWEKQLVTALKKVTIEDLGDLQAVDLWDSIPDRDGNGRGRYDLVALQKDLMVHVEFSRTNGHVYLVGAKTKLAKKCITLRNILSHYHWRLSGKDAHA